MRFVLIERDDMSSQCLDPGLNSAQCECDLATFLFTMSSHSGISRVNKFSELKIYIEFLSTKKSLLLTFSSVYLVHLHFKPLAIMRS